MAIINFNSISGVSTISVASSITVGNNVSIGTDRVTATTFSGNLTGNVTGNLNSTGITSITQLHVGAGGTIISTTGIGSVGIGITNPSTKLHVEGGQIFGNASSNAQQNYRYGTVTDVNWFGSLNQSVSGGTIANTIAVAGQWDVNGTTYNCTKDYNGTFPSAALSIQNQYNSTLGPRFAFLSKAAGSTTTDGSVTELVIINNTGVGINSITPSTKFDVVSDSSNPSASFYRQRNTTGGALLSLYDDVSSTRSLVGQFISGGDLYLRKFLNTKNITTFSYTQDLYGSTTIDFNFDSTESTSHFVLLSSSLGCTGFAAIIMITQHYVGSEGTLDVYRNNARYGTVSYSLSAAGTGTALNNKLIVNCGSLGWGCGGSKPSTGTVYLTILSSGAATSQPI